MRINCPLRKRCHYLCKKEVHLPQIPNSDEVLYSTGHKNICVILPLLHIQDKNSSSEHTTGRLFECV